jgi:glycosyltransferase involved in cell wall biosynthesis
VVQGHGAGLTVPPEDPQTLADAILRLAEDEALCLQYGRNARHYAEEFLDREAILSRFEQRLETLARVRGQA